LVVGALASLPAQAQTASATELDELKRLIQQQQQQIEAQSRLLQQLQTRVQQLSQRPRPAAAPVQPAATSIPPKVAQSGSKDVTLSLSGQVNRAALILNDGESTKLFNVDNDNSSTRVRWDGRAKVSDDFKIGTRIEVQFESNSTVDVSQLDDRGVSANNFTERKLELWFDTALGKLSLGQGDTASNQSAEVDLSGTNVVAYSSVIDLAGGAIFRNGTTSNLLGAAGTDIQDRNGNGKLQLGSGNGDGNDAAALTVGRVFTNFDGLSRDDRLRYDTPKFAGFTASASAIADGRWDTALRFGGGFGPLKVAAAVAYARRPGIDRVDGSISLLHASGLSLTFSSGGDDRTGRDPFNWYVKAGYRAKWWALGETRFSVDYTESRDIAVNGDEATSIGGAIVQYLDKAGTEVYVGARNYNLDRAGLNSEDIFAVLAGARVKF